jgi:molybdopterin-containing oxidoreductase family iron-sulfur binding subunit
MTTSAALPARRPVLKTIGLFLLGLLASGRKLFAQGPPRSARARRGTSERPAKWGMAIDLDLCTACGACAVACSSENNVPLLVEGPGSEGTGIHWMDFLVRESAHGGGPPEVLPTPCMHCDNAPCTKVCPVGATYVDEEGIVAQIWDRCIGCRYCQAACPYSRRYFNWQAPQWPESLKSCLNPDVATRPNGVVEKCTFCQHRIRAARETARREERTLRDADVVRLPACAQACPASAIVFGDLNDESSLVTRLARSPRASRLLEHLGTRPKVFYLAKDRRNEP